MSLPTLSQNGRTKSEGTRFNRETSVVIGEALVACDFAFKKVDILVNTISSQDLMLEVAKDNLDDRDREIQKRDYIIARKDSEYKSLEDLNESLRQDLRKERRKGVWKDVKTVGGFILGGAVGYFGADMIK